MLFDCAEMADGRATTTTTATVGGHHVTGETREMIDSIDTTDTITTTNTAILNSQTDASLAASHSAREDNKIRKRDTESSQELNTAQLQEVIMFRGQDADLTTTDVPTIEQSGTELGCAETTQQNLHQSVGYKREHSHSPCSQTSPLQQLPTSACRAVGCIVESEQELVVDGEVLKSSGGGRRELEEERQPRKRVKREATMEGGEGDGRNRHTCK